MENALANINVENAEEIKCACLKGLLDFGYRGYDVIMDAFFVEYPTDTLIPFIKKMDKQYFTNFEDYYNFLNGDIYNYACYAFLPPNRIDTSRNMINIHKLMDRNSFINNVIDDYTLTPTENEIKEYRAGASFNSYCKKWIKKFNACDDYDKLKKTIEALNKESVFDNFNKNFFLFSYIYSDVNDRKRFDNIMKCISVGTYPYHRIFHELCSIYHPDDVFEAFSPSQGTKTTQYRHKRKVKEYIDLLKSGKVVFTTHSFFDVRTHFYCDQKLGYIKGEPGHAISSVCRYFETFEEFASYKSKNLYNCDLSRDYGLKSDMINYKINNATILPFNYYSGVNYLVEKRYRDNKFFVIQNWISKDGTTVKSYTHEFSYFFDFVTFLKGDMSDADLISCEGLCHLYQWEGINFEKAQLNSQVQQKLGIEQDKEYIMNNELIGDFECIEKNEIDESLDVLPLERGKDDKLSSVESQTQRLIETLKRMSGNPLSVHTFRISYISDIHLMHRIQDAGCKTKEDVICLIRKIASTIAQEARGFLLIGGDVSSDFTLFQVFVEYLEKELRPYTTAIFVLGNHELWSFPELKLDDILKRYRECLNKHKMYLLHNDILYWEVKKSEKRSSVQVIPYSEVNKMSNSQIVEQLRYSRCVIIGGVGFSGYNEEFNAKNGIYRRVLSRADEIEETKKFELLYNRVSPLLSNKNAIIFTHMPKKDWSSNKLCEDRIIYISGHTHRNYFRDNGISRIYADNQIGYHRNLIHLKEVLIGSEHDCFSDYSDGIYTITKDQYNDFYGGKNLRGEFQRENYTIHMLKKKEYYLFIAESANEELSILNGGSLKRIRLRRIRYYYENMDAMIAKLKEKLDLYTEREFQVSNMVKKIGGDGEIHGAIVDIDFWSHIYINPLDLTVTGYSASDMKDKIVYPSIYDLIKNCCPHMLDGYNKILNENPNALACVKGKNDELASAFPYYETDIYKMSDEIVKMQKLYSRVLTVWYENILPPPPIIEIT